MNLPGYLMALLLALPLLLFPLDLGLQKGARLGVEYAAFCAARAAATQIPARSPRQPCLTPAAYEAIRFAAAACLSAIASKRDLPRPEAAVVLRELVRRTEPNLRVEILDSQAQPRTCFAAQAEIIAEVSYRYFSPVPLSPLHTGGGVLFSARARAMLQTR